MKTFRLSYYEAKLNTLCRLSRTGFSLLLLLFSFSLLTAQEDCPELTSFEVDPTEVCEGELTYIIYLGTAGAIVDVDIPGVGSYSSELDATGYFAFGFFADPGTYTASLVSISTEDCTEDLSDMESIDFTVFANPEVTSFIADPADVCEGETTYLIAEGTPDATIVVSVDGYGDVIIDINGIGIGSESIEFPAGDYTVSLSEVYDENCSVALDGDDVEFTVNQNPELDVFFIDPLEVCEGEITGIVFGGPVGATVTASIDGDDFTAEIGADGTVTTDFIMEPGDYTVSLSSLSDDNCTSDLDDWTPIDFTVLAAPEVSTFEIDEPTICLGEDAFLIIEGTPNSSVFIALDGAPLTSLSLDSDGYVEALIGGAPNTYNFSLITITDENGCVTDLSDIPTLVYTVLPNPTMDGWAFENDAVCDGDPLVLMITGTPNATITLDDGLGTVLLDGDGEGSLDLFLEPGTGTIAFDEITLGDCFTDLEDEGDLSYEVYALPELIDFYVQITPVCEGEPTWITLEGQPDAMASFNISGVGDVDVTLDAAGFANYGLFADAGVYSASLISITDDNCTASLDWPAISFEVLPLPELTSITVDPDSSCDGEPTFIFLEGTPDATISLTVNGDPYDITLDGVGLGSTTLVLGPGTYTVQPVEANDACYSDLSDMASTEFTVKPNPELLTFDVTPEACDGELIWLSFTGTPGASINVSVPGVGTYDTDPLDAGGSYSFGFFAPPGDYTATLNSITLDGCTTDLSAWAPVDFTVLPLPEVTSFSVTETTCAGELIFVDIEGSPGASGSINISNEDADFDIGISFDEDGLYSTSGTLSPGEWVFTLGEFELEGCFADFSDQSIDIIVKPNPELNTFDVTSVVCEGELTSVTFNGTPDAVVNVDIPGVGNYDSFPLDEDGNYSFSFIAAPGNYTATLTTITLNGCVVDLSDWAPIDFEVLPVPEITDFTVVPASICEGDEFTFTVVGTPGAEFEVNYTFNDIPVTEILPLDEDGIFTVTTAFIVGEYVFTLGSVTLNGCEADYSNLSNTLSVNPYPELDDFYMGPSTTCEGDATFLLLEGTPGATVDLNISGIGDITVVLDEDGEYAEALTPEAGTYTATLTSISMNGCSVDLSGEPAIDFTINPSPEFISFTFIPETVCDGGVVAGDIEGTPGATLNYTISGFSSYSDVIGPDGTVSFSYSADPGEYTATFTSITLGDCVVDLSDETPISFTVNPNPELNTFTVSPEVCEGELTLANFNGTTDAVVSVEIPGIGNYDSFPLDEDGNYSFGFVAAPGTYTATLTTISLNGCTIDLSDWAPIDFTILPSAELTDFAVTEDVCSGDLVTVSYVGTPDAWVNVDIPGVGNYDSQLDSDGNYSFSFFAADGTYTATVNSIELDGCVTALNEALTFTVEECLGIECESYGISSEDKWINHVMHNGGDFDNISGDDGGYGDYTAMTVEIAQGGVEELTMEPGFLADDNWTYWRVWVDWNQNGVFDNNEREIQKRTKTSFLGDIEAPADAKLGLTFMRVSMKFPGYPTPCAIFDEGEVEDYTVMVVAGAASAAVEVEEPDNIAEVNTDIVVTEDSEEVEADDNTEAVTGIELDETEVAISIDTEEGNDLSNVSMKLYPNPTADVLNIAFEELNDYSKVDIKIYNERGQVIMSQVPNDLNHSEMQISVEHLNPGIYMVVLGSEGQKITTQRFIKIH